MKITFPHMGRVYIPLRSIFEELGAEVIMPPANNNCIKELGLRYAPEYACIPFKLILGNILYSLEKGADTVIMLGGSGPCRFGYFGYMLNLILKDIGFSFNFINLEPSSILSVLTQLKHLPQFSYSKLASGILLGWEKLRALDALEKNFWNMIPYIACKNKAKDLYDQAVKYIARCSNITGLRKMCSEYQTQLGSMKDIRELLPRVCMLGDIYTLNEPYSNYFIEKYLSDRGIQVTRSIYTSTWVKNNFVPWSRHRINMEMLRCVRGYMNNRVGGNGMETIYNALKYADMGYDGILHIMPITCMPEIVSRQVLAKISREKKISVMHITVDEHNDRTLLETRLEAFVEILSQKI